MKKFKNFKKRSLEMESEVFEQPSELIQRLRKSKWPAVPFDEALEFVDNYFQQFQSILKIPVQQLKYGKSIKYYS